MDGFVTPMPPCPALLTHNHPPTILEQQAIHEVVSKVNIAIASIESELARLTSAKDQLQRFRVQHQGVTSSLRRIPNEILIEIMKWSMPTYDPLGSDYDYRRSKQSRCMALTLASVCSRWREAAISTPQLWAFIVWESSKYSPLLTKRMLSRSGECNLALHIHVRSLEDQGAMLEALSATFHRMELVLNSSKLMTDIIVDGPSFQRLRTLQITTELATSYLLKVFKNCPYLEDAEICIDDTDAGSVTFEAITMRRLYRLLIKSGTNPSAFLDCLTTPNLVEFAHKNHYPYIWPTSKLVELLQRSKASLRKLNVKRLGDTTNNIRAILDVAPHLSELHLSEDYLTMHYFSKYLTVQAEHSSIAPPLPELKELTIYRSALSPHKSLYQMIASRAIKCPLKKITMHFDDLTSFQSGPFAKLWQNAGRLGCVMEVRTLRDCVVRIDKHGDYLFE